MNLRTPLVALFTAILFVACSSDVVAPLKVPMGPKLSVNADGTGTYLVLMKGNGVAKGFNAAVTSLGGTVLYVHSALGFAGVAGLTADGATQLSSVAGVSDVMSDVQVSLNSPLSALVADEAAVADPTIESVNNPGAAFFHTWQWDMHLIRADSAWAHGRLGNSAVTVAILDTGLDYDSFDLNGLVDLSRSTSFVPSDDAFRATNFPARNNVSDFEGHGTNVASQVSSKAVGFAGVTSKTTLIGVKVLGRTGSGSLGGVLNGILWAADHGANVANMSLGGSFTKTGNGVIIGRFINRVFNYAHQKGMLIVVAAGNALPPDYVPVDLQHNGNTYDTYCDSPHVICVSAVGPTTYTVDATGQPQFNGDATAWYSYYGQSVVSVAAPGGNYDPVSPTVSAWPWGNGIASAVWSLCSKTRITGVNSTTNKPIFGCSSGTKPLGELGTSQAAPHVSGLAALLIAEYGITNPETLKHVIEQSSDPIDPLYGRGRINAQRALGL